MAPRVRHLTTEELAERLGGDISPRTLEGWRRDGTGPKFIRPGGQKVRYREIDIEAWEESLVTEPGTRKPQPA